MQPGGPRTILPNCVGSPPTQVAPVNGPSIPVVVSAFLLLRFFDFGSGSDGEASSLQSHAADAFTKIAMIVSNTNHPILGEGQQASSAQSVATISSLI
jgi:hypothetical protein